jgi:hypothetical protein
MLIPLLCDGVWKWAMETAVIAGELAEAPSADMDRAAHADD